MIFWKIIILSCVIGLVFGYVFAWILDRSRRKRIDTICRYIQYVSEQGSERWIKGLNKEVKVKITEKDVQKSKESLRAKVLDVVGPDTVVFEENDLLKILKPKGGE